MMWWPYLLAAVGITGITAVAYGFVYGRNWWKWRKWRQSREAQCPRGGTMKRTYRGWFGRTARRRCPHVNLEGIYGDQIRHVGHWRLFCKDCGQFLDGPVYLALRRAEPPLTQGGQPWPTPPLPTYE